MSFSARSTARQSTLRFVSQRLLVHGIICIFSRAWRLVWSEGPNEDNSCKGDGIHTLARRNTLGRITSLATPRTASVCQI